MISLYRTKEMVVSYDIQNLEDMHKIIFLLLKLKKADYLPVIRGIPVFSEKAKNIFEKIIPDEMSFYECIIECDGGETIFFIGKVNDYLTLINNKKSSYRKLSDNRNIICKPFLIIRGSFL